MSDLWPPRRSWRKWCGRFSTWIIKNQLGRRNLIPAMRVKLELALKPLMMAKAKENMKSGGGDKKSGLSNLTNPIERSITRKQIADSAGVSEGTVHNVETVLADGIEDVKADMLSNRRGRDRMASLAVAWKSNAMTSNFNADRAALGATVS